MKHIKLFENFTENESLLFSIKDVIKEFPEIMSIWGSDEGPGMRYATLEVYKLDPPYPRDKESVSFPDHLKWHVNFDPSFYDNKIKLKLVFVKKNSYGGFSGSTIYMGLSEYSKSNVIDWFRNLLNDPSREDYLPF